MIMNDISCPVCFNVFSFECTPVNCCQNGHTVCAECFKNLQTCEHYEESCPICRDPLLDKPIVNRSLLQAVETFTKFEQSLNLVPEIDAKELVLSEEPFASGGFADIYDAKWHSQTVAVKVLRATTEITQQLDSLGREAKLAIGLFHPNIVRLFGTATVKRNKFGIVMEKVDNGSLDKIIFTISSQLAVKVALGIVDGLSYVHMRKIAHRDLKPQNVLLAGAELIPKITDFGISKVLQTVATNTELKGTPKYMAPEMVSGGKYDYSVDIYSLSVILFEMFSGQPADKGFAENPYQLVFAIVRGKRPTIPSTFPEALRPLVEKGWDNNPTVRPSLQKFREGLHSFAESLPSGSIIMPKVKVEPKSSTPITKLGQAELVAQVNLPVPVLSLKWDAGCEVHNSFELRQAMIEDLRNKSTMKNIINESVLSVMKVVPRHLFMDEKRMIGIVSKQSPSKKELINAAYTYNKPIAATMASNESSPEIIGTQLSMTEIIQGQSVLLVGLKGGYIQSVVAQLVGINGMVVTATSHRDAMAVCRDRINEHCPLKAVVHWVDVDNVNSEENLVAALLKRSMQFHTVVYCGAVDAFPLQLTSILDPGSDVSIMAPVKTGEAKQLQFQLYLRRHNSTPEMRTITDFGVLFEDVH